MIVLVKVLIVVAALAAFYAYWRHVWFFRDPERTPPDAPGAILSPADGTVIYVRQVTPEKPPVCLKNGRPVPLYKYLGNTGVTARGYLIGVFMHPMSVHVNRAPVAGEICDIEHHPGSNISMTRTWLRTKFRIRPFEARADHLLENERNIVRVRGLVDLLVIQIADVFVNRIECRVHEGQHVAAGERIGMIRFGSQVDLFIARDENVEIVARVGDKVKAGESIVARISGPA